MAIGLLLCAALLQWGAAEAGAGAWTLPRGAFWGKVTFLSQSTDEWYASSRQFLGGEVVEAGSRVPYNFDGMYESRALFLEGFYGVTDRLDFGVQVPYFDQTFADATRAEPVSDAGLSDVRVFAKLGLLQKPALLTLKTGAKMPTGKFKNEDGLIPVGEGQWDFDFIVQVGRSFWPLPLYANVDAGYRVRLKNEEVDRDPGDEWFANGEVGYNISRKVLLSGKFEVLRSDPSTDFGSIVNRSQIKRIAYLSPYLSYSPDGRWALELGLRFSTGGRNFPAGRQLVLGLSTEVGRR